MSSSKNSEFEHNYSFSDRLIHKIAFSHPILQRALGDLESDLYKKEIGKVSCKPPVFVAGLPRSGTTLALEFLYSTGEFSTFTYRHMPFLLAPILWQNLSKGFQKQAVKAERAHGDGMEISFDSPEAFEEALWLNFYKSKYLHENHLSSISKKDIDDDFRSFFRNLTKKLIFQSSLINSSEHYTGRYLSKNNANISRIPAIINIFPESHIVVCIRDPIEHVLSLSRQHERFLAIHNQDAFSKKYMEWVGHYDFGVNFKPIKLTNELQLQDINSLDHTFWLSYWIHIYKAVDNLSSPNKVYFCHEVLLENPEQSLTYLASKTGIDRIETLLGNKSKIAKKSDKSNQLVNVSDELLKQAYDIYQSIRNKQEAAMPPA